MVHLLEADAATGGRGGLPSAEHGVVGSSCFPRPEAVRELLAEITQSHPVSLTHRGVG